MSDCFYVIIFGIVSAFLFPFAWEFFHKNDKK